MRQRKVFISLIRDLQDKVERSFPSLKLDQNFLKQSNFFLKTLTWGLIASTGFAITWLVFAYTDEVVLVNGKLEPIGDVKKIQIPVGGVIKEILVKAGDRVSEGQILIVLDKEISQQNLKSLEDQLYQKNIQLELKKEEKNKTNELYLERINVLQKRLTIQKNILAKFQSLLEEGAVPELRYLEEINKENQISGKIIDNQKDLLGKLINYDFDYLFSDLNIQWISATQLKNLEGRIRFKIKDLESNTSLPDSALFNALKVFNLNALVSNLSDETSFISSKLIISRAEGDFYIGQNRALLTNPIKFETAEAKMSWTGEILKNDKGLIDQLDLSLDMRLKVSENIPWYAAIFGGIPALAGGFVLENIIDERVDDASTFKFNITGTIDDPKITRLN